ncbi:MAG: hypothetical protein IJ341_02310 [Bacteroidales bacterium]|nr:hypothetical protein [Bacteroidales bacterium]
MPKHHNETTINAYKEITSEILKHQRKMCSSDFTGEFWDYAVLAEDIQNILNKKINEANLDVTANDRNCPPCNVGDTVYYVNSITLSHYTVTEIRYDGRLWYFNCENKNYSKAHRTFGFFESSINDTIFLNKADANAAYARKRNQMNN